MENIFDTGNGFEKNQAILADALHNPLPAVQTKIATLCGGVSGQMTIGGPDSYSSIALLEYLSGGQRRFIFREGDRATAQSFYAEKWDEPGHHTIDFFRHNHRPEIIFEVVDAAGELAARVDFLWAYRADIEKYPDAKSVVEQVIRLLDFGVYRVAEPDESAPTGWKVNQWLKKAVLLYFQLHPNELVAGNPFNFYDKVKLKFGRWSAHRFERAGFRAVPGALVREGAYIAKKVILMPSFVNIGGYVGEGTMIDTSATVGSCAQIGKNCHISGGAGIGGVLEPLQANPVIIEDGCFIGARSEVAEGVIVKKGAVLSMGVFIGKNTPIVDRTRDGLIIRGVVPEYSVVMMGTHPDNGLTCPHIVKIRDEKTDAAVALNETLRSYVAARYAPS